MKKPLNSRALAYLEKVASAELDSDTKQAVSDKRIILEDEPIYVRKKIEGGGEVELLTADLDEAVGITNIDKRKLGQFVYFILEKIQFGYGSSAVANNAIAVAVQYASLIAGVPIPLQHANLIIKQNDVPIYTIPVKQLLQQEKTREFEGDAGYELDYQRLIKPNVPFQISIKFPEGQVLQQGVVDHFVEIFLKGTRTRLRGAK